MWENGKHEKAIILFECTQPWWEFILNISEAVWQEESETKTLYGKEKVFLVRGFLLQAGEKKAIFSAC